MLASDGRGKNTTAFVVIRVRRDEQPPQFIGLNEQGRYDVYFSENLAVNATATNVVKATDPDRPVGVSKISTKFCGVSIIFSRGCK